MKTFYVILFFLFASCAPTKVTTDQPFSTPESTFNILVQAILKDDLGLYKSCWMEERLESEGMYSKLSLTSSKWAELKGIFAGPQTMKQKVSKEATFFKTSIHAPKAKQGGIGAISMQKVGNKWLLYSW